MAKQAVNIVERHVEKAVLGVCAASFLAAVALYVVSTPNKIELGSQMVGPDGIDSQILDAAHQLRDKINRARAETFDVEDPLPKLVDASSPLAYAGLEASLPAPVPMLPRVPDVDLVPVEGEIELAQVIAPQDLRITHARATVNLPRPSELGTSGSSGSPEATTDANWVTVAAMFDQQDQINVNKQAGYDVTHRNPYVVSVDLQRREKLPTGTYGDWVDVKTFLPARLPDEPLVEIWEDRGKIKPTSESYGAANDYFRLVKGVQADIMRPLFPDIVHGEGWIYPKFADIDVASLDRELCTAGNDKACLPREYPRQWDIAPNEDAEEKSARELIEQKLGEAQAAINNCQWAEARNLAKEVIDDKNARKNQKDQAEQLKKDADQGERDVNEGRRPDCSEGQGDANDDVTTARRSQYQTVWAHDVADASEGGAQSGKTYQYRTRLRLLNQYCAEPGTLKNADDATEVTVVGEWSNPSEDVSIPAHIRFFLSRGNPRKNSAKVSVFKWYEGVWVSTDFEVRVGRPIRGNARRAVRVLKNGDVDKPLVDFDTGMTCVDIDFEYMDRSLKRSSKGVTLGTPTKTVSLVYRDENGVLGQRSLLLDRSSGAFKAFKGRVFDPGSSR